MEHFSNANQWRRWSDQRDVVFGLSTGSGTEQPVAELVEAGVLRGVDDLRPLTTSGKFKTSRKL